jgi:hypothetical protein
LSTDEAHVTPIAVWLLSATVRLAGAVGASRSRFLPLPFATLTVVESVLALDLERARSEYESSIRAASVECVPLRHTARIASVWRPFVTRRVFHT